MTEEERLRRKYRNIVMVSGAVLLLFVITLPLWSKAKYDSGLLLMTIIACLCMVGIYFTNVKGYVLREQLKPLFNMGVKSRNLDYARVFLHYGRYRMALMKLKFVALDYPENKEIKSIIAKVEEHMKK